MRQLKAALNGEPGQQKLIANDLQQNSGDQLS
jgi:hypothetical protein